MKNVRLALGAALALSIFAASARADEAAAKKYLDDAEELIGKGSSFFNDATGKLDLAEASLDDVAEPAKAQLKTRLDGLRGKITSAAGEQEKGIRERKVKQLIEECEGAVGNLVVWPGKSAELTEFLNDPKTVAALGQPAADGYKKQFALMAKVHNGKALKDNLASATQEVTNLEKLWQEKKTAAAAADTGEEKARLLGQAENDIEAMPRFFKDLPADNGDVKALQARVDKIKTEFAAGNADAGGADQLDRIRRYFESYANEFDGMDAETKVPTWADFKTSANDARDLGAPKTINYVTRVSRWLPELEQEDKYVAAKDNPAVKAKVAEVRVKLAASREKLKKNAEALVAGYEAEKANANNAGDSGMLESRIKYAFGDASPEAGPLVARVTAVNQAARDASNKADADKDAYYKNLTEQANKAWPAMLAKYDISTGFDANNAGALKGKFIKITGNNLMGWRFKTGDFSYATKLGGIPVAGNYSPDVKAALSEVEAKLGRAIGDSDDDGEWIAVARVEGRTGRLIELVQRSGDVSVDGRKVGTVEGTDERPTDAPVVTIVALKAGPVAVAQDQGAVKADGSIAAPVAAAGGAAGGRRGFSFIGILSGLLAIVVGGACLMKSKFAPLAGNAQAAQLTEKVGGQNLAYLGLAGVALGVIGLLLNLLGLASHFFIAVIGLIASAAMIVAGVVVSRDLLESRGLLPGSVATPMATYAVPAGLACVGLGLLTLVLSVF